VPFTLPDHVEAAPETLRAVAERHGLPTSPLLRLPDAGIFNAVYRLGDVAILRIPRNHPKFIAASLAESIAVPAARRAGVRTPRLLAFDDRLDLLPVPYTVYELVPGCSLEACDLDPSDAAEAWREVGRDLARTHTGVSVAGAISTLPARMTLGDPRRFLDERVEQGWLSWLDARWFGRWLDRLAPTVLVDVPTRFLHGDTQGTNVMVEPDPIRYRAIIDWGSAALGDVACDFAGVPLRAVPLLLEGHREVTVPDGDDTLEARILWRHLQLSLWTLPRGAVPDRSWAERPWPALLEVLRFFTDPPSDRWRAIGPAALAGL
jgi:aminoglycoside phosphotransferase (APT) family kinase protein